MRTVTITAYHATAAGLPRVLQRFMDDVVGADDSTCFNIRCLSKSSEMVETLTAADRECNPRAADIAMFTWQASKLHELDSLIHDPEQPVTKSDPPATSADCNIRYEITDTLFEWIVAPSEYVVDFPVLELSDLKNKHLVTYRLSPIERTSLAQRIYGDDTREFPPDVCVHEVPDTVTLNAFVRSGFGYGVSIGKGVRSLISPGLVGVPLQDAEAIYSIVARRIRRGTTPHLENMVNNLFRYLVRLDTESEPSWIKQNVISTLDGASAARLTALIDATGLSEEEVIANALQVMEDQGNRYEYHRAGPDASMFPLRNATKVSRLARFRFGSRSLQSVDPVPAQVDNGRGRSR